MIIGLPEFHDEFEFEVVPVLAEFGVDHGFALVVVLVVDGCLEVLEAVGITADSLGHLSLDKESLAETINNGDSRSAFDTLNELKSSIGKAASKASINPMAYVDKAIVEYKNPGKSLAAPYATSAYSGMMVNYGL